MGIQLFNVARSSSPRSIVKSFTAEQTYGMLQKAAQMGVELTARWPARGYDLPGSSEDLILWKEAYSEQPTREQMLAVLKDPLCDARWLFPSIFSVGVNISSTLTLRAADNPSVVRVINPLYGNVEWDFGNGPAPLGSKKYSAAIVLGNIGGLRGIEIETPAPDFRAGLKGLETSGGWNHFLQWARYTLTGTRAREADIFYDIIENSNHAQADITGAVGSFALMSGIEPGVQHIGFHRQHAAFFNRIVSPEQMKGLGLRMVMVQPGYDFTDDHIRNRAASDTNFMWCNALLTAEGLKATAPVKEASLKVARALAAAAEGNEDAINQIIAGMALQDAIRDRFSGGLYNQGQEDFIAYCKDLGIGYFRTGAGGLGGPDNTVGSAPKMVQLKRDYPALTSEAIVVARAVADKAIAAAKLAAEAVKVAGGDETAQNAEFDRVLKGDPDVAAGRAIVRGHYDIDVDPTGLVTTGFRKAGFTIKPAAPRILTPRDFQ